MKKSTTFSLKKYLGKWYEQGSTPAWFSKGCSNSSALYKKRKDGTVDVYNSCNKKGDKKAVRGRAYLTKNDRHLKVGFFPKRHPLFRSPYHVEYVESNGNQHSAAIVTSNNKAWILTRKKNISDKEYSRLLKKANKLGIKISGIKRTTQK